MRKKILARLEDVVGERKARIAYYLGNELDKEYNPPEAFWFTVKSL